MNNQQLKYAKERILETWRKKSNEIYDKYKDEMLSPIEVWEKLRNGDFIVKPEPPAHTGRYLSSYLEFPGEIDVSEKRKKALDDLEQEKRKMLDKLILGDAQDALDMLNEFAKKDF